MHVRPRFFVRRLLPCCLLFELDADYPPMVAYTLYKYESCGAGLNLRLERLDSIFSFLRAFASCTKKSLCLPDRSSTCVPLTIMPMSRNTKKKSASITSQTLSPYPSCMQPPAVAPCEHGRARSVLMLHRWLLLGFMFSMLFVPVATLDVSSALSQATQDGYYGCHNLIGPALTLLLVIGHMFFIFSSNFVGPLMGMTGVLWLMMRNDTAINPKLSWMCVKDPRSCRFS